MIQVFFDALAPMLHHLTSAIYETWELVVGMVLCVPFLFQFLLLTFFCYFFSFEYSSLSAFYFSFPNSNLLQFLLSSYFLLPCFFLSFFLSFLHTSSSQPFLLIFFLFPHFSYPFIYSLPSLLFSALWV